MLGYTIQSSDNLNKFTIGGDTVTSYTNPILNDNIVELSLGTGVAGTDAKDVTYTPGTVTDLAGNPLGAFTDTSTIDGAGPVVMSILTTSPDTIDVTFSEDLDEASVTPVDFEVDSNTVTGTSENSGVVTLTLGTNIGTGDTPWVTVYGDGSAVGVQDLVGNWGWQAVEIIPADGIAS